MAATGEAYVGAITFLVLFIIICISLFIAIFPFWKIFSKAGYPGALAILMMLPLANIILLFFLALAEWPVLSELNELRKKTGSRL